MTYNEMVENLVLLLDNAKQMAYNCHADWLWSQLCLLQRNAERLQAKLPPSGGGKGGVSDEA